MNDENKNNHYKIDKIELKDVFERCKMHFFIQNAIKYIVRFDRKGTPNDDIFKAYDYLTMTLTTNDVILFGGNIYDFDIIEKFTNQFQGMKKTILVHLFKSDLDKKMIIELMKIIKELLYNHNNSLKY